MRCKSCDYHGYDYANLCDDCGVFGEQAEDYSYEFANGDFGCKFSKKKLDEIVLDQQEELRQ